MPVSLGELATRFGCELIGDPDVVVSDVASLPNATPASLTFFSNQIYREQLAQTRAAAVILRPADAEDCPVAAFLQFDFVDFIEGEQPVHLRTHQSEVLDQQGAFFLQVSDLLTGLGVAVVKRYEDRNDYRDQGYKDDPVIKISVLEVH